MDDPAFGLGTPGGSEEPDPLRGYPGVPGGTSRRATQPTHRRRVPGRYTLEGKSVLLHEDDLDIHDVRPCRPCNQEIIRLLKKSIGVIIV